MSSSGSDTGTNIVKVTVDPAPDIDLAFEELNGVEELGRPFLYEVQFSSPKASSTISSWLGSKITVSFQKTGEEKRYVSGIITRAIYSGLVAGAYRYKVEVRPWIWLLTRKQDCKIFQSKSAYDIITGIFSDEGFSGSFSDSRQNSAGSTVLDYCVQYNETSFDFVTRLMELWGLYYYIKHADGSHTLVICDDPNSHDALTDPLPFSYRQTDYRQTVDHIWEWTSELRLHSGAYTTTDYNFTTPAADLTGKSTTADTSSHPYSSYEMFRYPGPHDTATVGQTLATVRMRDLTMRGSVYRGTTNSRLMYTGCKFTMSEAADTTLNQEYTVIQATTHLRAAEGRATDDGSLVDAMRTTFYAIVGTVNFQLAQLTPRPMVRGPQTAKIVGASGDEITTDQYGRVKCKFPWDRSTTQDENSSCWIRVSQVWAGLSWGSMFIPRVGQEVIVEYLEGNPDRPIITGRVYNATQTVPYTLPDNATQSTMKSNSSKGGGGYNELRFEDKKSSEEVYFQAQKDYNKVVLNNETVKVTQDSTTTIDKGNRSVTLNTGNNSLTVSKGDHSLTVSKGNSSATISEGNNTLTVSKGDHSVTVSTGNSSATISTGNDSLTVAQGNHSVDVSAGASSITAAQSITLKVGGNSITIDTSGITISGTMFSIKGSATGTVDGGGELTVKGGVVKIN